MPILHLGIRARQARLLLRGSFAGPEGQLDQIRRGMLQVAEEAPTAPDLLGMLERLASREGFTLETEPIRNDELRFYFWRAE